MNKSILAIEHEVEHLARCGLVTKPTERLEKLDSVRVLGLSVDSNLHWKRGGQIPKISDYALLTKRQVRSYICEWLGHFPVCG